MHRCISCVHCACVCVCAGQGRMHAAEQRKERESLEEAIHSIQLESELTSRALKQTVSVSAPPTHCFTALTSSVGAVSSLLW